MHTRPKFFLGVIVGLFVGIVFGSLATAHAATGLEGAAERIARALERIAQAADHGANR